MKSSDIYPVIGMSPGNSYFKDEEVRHLLREVVSRYGRTAILIADTPAISTYLALGYSESQARNKAIPKGNNLKNRTRRIMNELGLAEGVVHIIDWDEEIKNSEAYQAIYQKIASLYKTNPDFEKSVNNTTRGVLEASDKNIKNIKEATGVAVHYLLSELAFLEFAPQFLNTKHVIYVYHKNWPVYEDYVAGKFDGETKLHLDFLLLEHPSETYLSLSQPTQTTKTEDSPPSENAYERIKRTKVIRASYEDYPPTFMRNKQSGEYKGIFYEILQRIAQENDLKIEFTEETGYGVIIRGLEERRFDIFASAVWPTPERIGSANFSIPIYHSDVYLWTREDEAIKTYLEVSQSSSFRLAVKENDISHSITMEEFPDARLIYVPQLADPKELLGFVANDKADGTFAEPYLVHEFNTASSRKLIPISFGEPIRRYGNTFMIRQGESDLKSLLDVSITNYLRSGYVGQLIKKYTGAENTFL